MRDVVDDIPTAPTLSATDAPWATPLQRPPDIQLPLEFERARARLAAQLFGVPVAAPRIGRFRLLDRLGAGAMGEVYTAFDPELDRRVAIKVLRAEYGETEGGRRRLLREAQALARVSHPNVVQVFEVGVHDEHIFIAMEHVRGRSLGAHLAGDAGSRDWQAVLDLFVFAGHGLAAVHAAGLVHRDFKPANVVVGEDRRVRILDFGLARPPQWIRSETGVDTSASDGMLHAGVTQTGSIAGTPAYMAPELFEGRSADEKSDQYSYCVALYEGLYGVLPFDAATLPALVAVKSRGAVLSPPTGSRVPTWLHAVVLRGLAVDPKARWPSMDAFLAELGRDRRTALRRWLFGAATVALVVMALAGAYRALEQQRLAARARERAEAAEQTARDEAARARAHAREREIMAEAERAAEVVRLANTPGRERDAMVLGIQVLAPHGPDFTEAPYLAVDGLAEAMPFILHSRTLPGSGERLLDLALSPDARTLASLDASHTLRIWDAELGTLRSAGRWAGEGPVDLAFSPDGSSVLISGDTCAVWDVATERFVHDLSPCVDGLFSADSATIYGHARQGPRGASLAAWDRASGQSLWHTPLADRAEALLVHPNGNALFVGFPGGDVQTFDPADGRARTLLRAPEAARRSRDAFLPDVVHLALSNDGEHLAVASGGLHVWDLSKPRPSARTFAPSSEFPFFELAFTSNDSRLFAGTTFENRVFSLKTGEIVDVSAPGGHSLHALDRTTVMLSASDGKLTRWGDRGEILEQLKVDHADIMQLQLAASANRTRLATGREQIRLWNIGDPRALQLWTPPPGAELVGGTGGLVIMRTESGLIEIFDPNAGRLKIQLARDEHDALELNAAHAHVHGDTLWTRRGDRVFLHDLRDGRLLRQFERAWPNVREPWISAMDAPRLALMNLDGTLDVFDADDGERRCVITGDGQLFAESGGASAGPFSMRDLLPRTTPQLRRYAALDRGGETLAVLDAIQVPDTRFNIHVRDDVSISTWSTELCQAQTRIVIPHEGAAARPLLQFGFASDGSLVTRLGTTTYVHEPTSGALRFRADDPCTYDRFAADAHAELSPVGDLLLTACEGRAFLWQIPTGERTELDGEVGRGDVAFTRGLPRSFFADGERIVLPDARGGALIWDTTSAAPVTRIHALDDSSLPVGLASDGQHLQILRYDGSVLTLNATRRGLFEAACKALHETDAWPAVEQACTAQAPASDPRLP